MSMKRDAVNGQMYALGAPGGCQWRAVPSYLLLRSTLEPMTLISRAWMLCSILS